jgi:UDP-2-acetamido-2,6-beta-L-arabino-hexul-4-ose reductase
MPAEVVIEEVPVYRDARGWVFEPIEADEFAHQRNAHLVLSEPGAVRGNHYHVLGTEIVVVMGPALVRFRRASLVRDVTIAEGQALRLRFPPGVSHAIQNTGTIASIMIAFNTEVHDRAAPDVVREILIPMS